MRPPETAADGRIRVMLVDDSAVVRGLITRTLEKDDQIYIVSSVHNGEMAVNTIKRVDPDIVLLDIEMPVMDGLTALPLLLQQKPDVKVLICSTLSAKGGAIAMKALSLGATECIAKPTSTGDLSGTAGDFSKDLVRIIKGLAKARVAAPAGDPPRKSSTFNLLKKTDAQAAPAAKKARSFTLRTGPDIYVGRPDIVAIGSSTGGPQALMEVLREIKNLPVPIVITQHMPKTFTAVLAQHIERNCGIPCVEGEDGMELKRGHAYVAPGGHHMLFEKKDGKVLVALDDGPPENFCKPSVDPMMKSIGNIYGKKTLPVILTGMGQDGLEGCRALTGMGAPLIAQDEATSIVWGMPGAVAEAGLCTEVLTLSKIGPAILKAVTGVVNKGWN
ncbi:MAG: chemotaxis response regulator protein-glutamate methylesterase [Proteobacteria bacterium]|nr:chemotaxis response regulator protein-glutamate methylesterase [Pseudomonadota bacterium]